MVMGYRATGTEVVKTTSADCTFSVFGEGKNREVVWELEGENKGLFVSGFPRLKIVCRLRGRSQSGGD